MVPKIFAFLFFLNAAALTAQTVRLQSPDEFLDGQYKKRFTPHHLLVDYFHHVASLSDKVEIVQYGSTYEHRPLIAAIISSPGNIRRIENIRQNNIRRARMAPGGASNEDIAIVYLSYSVHGNEAAGSESSMSVLHTLAQGGTDVDKWLANTVVIIDPSLNPDGYSRYSQWNNSISNAPYNVNPDTREHDEPWPGGRVNHYYFDLNRDWAWQTQKESRDRIAFYLKWMPHVHADVHEMSYGSSYYFAPAAQPYHPYLTDWQADFQVEIGRNHAAHFDKHGWRYFTKEYFDLFYPSYGDTYPMMSGAIGMTYEQAGHSAAGRAIVTSINDTLKLADRIAHHYTTSISTIEVSSNNASRLVDAFGKYFEKSVSDPAGNYRSFIIKKSNSPGRVHDFLSVLRLNGIEYAMLAEDARPVKGYSYFTGEETSFIPEKADIVIHASQARSAILHALFEPETELTDSVTYDITAWSLPMAFGLETYATNESFNTTPYKPVSISVDDNEPAPYAYVMEWGSVPAARQLASIIQSGINARYAVEEFKVNGEVYAPGTVVVMRADNRTHPSFDDVMRSKLNNSVVPVATLSTGFVESGKDLGSESYRLIRRPQALVASGSETSALSLGQVWHFFEEELNYPVHLVDFANLNTTHLAKYNIIIFPEGYYKLTDELTEKINDWVRSGGQLIALGSAVRQFAGKEGYSIKSKNGMEEKPVAEDPAHYPSAYDASMRRLLSEEIAGAVFRTTTDRSHPLSFGLGPVYWTLKTSSSAYSWLPGDGNAVFLENKPVYYGFAGRKAYEKIARTLVGGTESLGNGGVVYLVDNPLFRSFWNSGKVLFCNALFF